MAFRYLRDPLFLLCVAAYIVNRFILKAVLHRGFAHNHLNDVICIPFWVPIMLFAERRIGMRTHDLSPRWYELIIPLVIWSAFFEVLLPLHPSFSSVAVADPVDVVCYIAGTAVAAMIWRYCYRDAPNRAPVVSD